MNNKEIAASFQLLARLMELHGENPYKIRSYQRAYAYLGKLGTPLSDMSEEEIMALPGVGKAISGKIGELLSVGKMQTLERYKEMTPPGIQEMVMVKGLGPKKIMTVWKTLGVESATELLYACTENRLVELKGFGSKTQEDVKNQMEFFLANRKKFIHLKVRTQAEDLLRILKETLPDHQIEITGALRRYQPIVCKIEYLLEAEQWPDLHDCSSRLEILTTSPDSLEAVLDEHLPVTIYRAQPGDFVKEWIRTTGPKELAAHLVDYAEDESTTFTQNGLPYVKPECRDLLLEQDDKNAVVLRREDINGVIHAHSTYSDGIDSIADLRTYAKSRQYQYLGITDHSQIAVYANGLDEQALIKQWQEIEELNAEDPDFMVLKGIECDILNDGTLDYSPEILEQFEFVIASIHTNIKMDEQKATGRLIKAIENPFTNILGHPTGRLLLGREGYPVDMQRIIDACAANQVAIELNASPYRLDLDWRWLPYAMDKGVLISVNPDAHAKEAIDYIDFGVIIARKGWLGPEFCLNARDVQGFKAFCQK